MSCWTWMEIEQKVHRTFLEKEWTLSHKAIESALRSRLAEEGSFMESTRQRYG